MAFVTGAILLPLSAPASQPVPMQLLLANSGSSALNILHVDVRIAPYGNPLTQVSAIIGSSPIGPGLTSAVPANGTLTMNYQLAGFSPAGSSAVAMPGMQTYIVTADIYPSDGSGPIAAAPSGFTIAPDPGVGILLNAQPGVLFFNGPNLALNLSLGVL